MGRGLSGWLVLARLFQILGSFIPGAMNGWLLYYISTNKLGPSKLMLVLELLVCLGTHTGLPVPHPSSVSLVLSCQLLQIGYSVLSLVAR